MRWMLRAGVGIGQPNHHDDVKKVQILLNRAIHESKGEILKEDGIFGPKTQARIAQFQQNTLHMHHVDAIVNKNGPTQRALRPHTSVPIVQTSPQVNNNPHLSPSHDAAIIPNSALLEMIKRHASQRPVNHKVAWFNRALPAALNVKAHWGVPIAVTLAQGALESNWGRHAPGNIFFGVKGKSTKGKTISVTTHENYGGKNTVIKDKFRAYDTLEESAEDYGQFLASNRRYAGAFAFRNEPEKFIHVVAVAGYASDPYYEKKILAIIRSNGLSDYDAPDIKTTVSFQNTVNH
ncbi:glucosaminidase domain-containing protein [Mangrovibacter plantisponsor]|uniref:Flagellar protein FlgJ n=1 Tax=Mangrovibacter plantisponsor TaxID=451513 RepID=A0A317Q791_9ENTR|nr:glucosaminidase domain-containing protein [Mangrovibacter plantisponsor]PWW11402.1 flagellar protein FlgJ [Mangrovibacter plantisponsor]